MMRVYFAGAWSDRVAVRAMAERVSELADCTITEAWWEKPAMEDVPFSARVAYMRGCAHGDLEGVHTADAVVFVHHEDTPGGWLEMGYALALRIPVIVTDDGSRRVAASPFCYLPSVRTVAPDAESIALALGCVTPAGRSATWPR